MMSMMGPLVLFNVALVTANANTKAEIELYQIEKNILAKTNQARSKHGHPPLKLDHGLLKSARLHGIWMAKNRALQHSNQMLAENIAMGQRSSSEVVYDWMKSPGHRANILNARCTRIGVAAYKARDGRIYWCQQFLR